MLFTIIVDRIIDGAYMVSLAYAKDIICAIYGCNSCRSIDDGNILGIEVGVDGERIFELDDIWGYRLISWDPMVNYLAQSYIKYTPNIPENLFKSFQKTTLIRWSEIDHYLNMIELLQKSHSIDFVAIHSPLLYQEAKKTDVAIINNKYQIIQNSNGFIDLLRELLV